MASHKDDILFKRRNKGRIHEDITKRVSFHEDTIVDEHKITELKVLACEAQDFDSESKKIFLDSYHEAEKFTSRSRSDSLRPLKPQSGKKYLTKKEFPPFFERGTPEGQEDPKKYSSTPNLSDFGSESGSLKDLANTSDVPRISNKSVRTLLVNRFLQSVPSKQLVKNQLAKRNNRISCLYVKNIKRLDLLDQSSITKIINDEISKNTRLPVTPPTLNPKLQLLVSSEDESIYKVFKVLKVDGSPLLAVITSNSLCFVSYCSSENDFLVENSFNFDDLVAAVVGPFSQIVIILNEEQGRVYLNTGIEKSLAYELMSHLEIAIRRWCSSNKQEFEFNAAEINDFKAISSFYDVLPENAFVKGETILGQYSVWLQEENVHNASSPLGPQKDGYIMTKIGVGASWVPSYLSLNAGVLYIFEKISLRVPKFAIPLRSPFYKGCRIHNETERPHSFDIILQGDSIFHFGAADETEMMDWIQALYSSASKTSNSIVDCDRESPVVNCFVTLTLNQVLLHQFPNKIISRAFLQDVTDFTISTWPQNYFCVLEFDCREASEMGDDWILYFVSKDTFDSFCLNFTAITHRTGMESQFDDSRFFASKSDRICARIRASWDSFFA
ncbi:pleckstrin homology domain-containing family M member 2 [Planococcus citri]|uniref:pleckstrin homology domain-containing family M member 2 n=1 Tax=Planococcus citri TaxID=170843 RepID=UPI0031F767AD